MSKKTLEEIVVRVNTRLQAPSRRRAWFIFTEAPSLVEVDSTQKKEIESDQYLTIVTRWGALEQAVPQKAKWSEGDSTQTTEEFVKSLQNKDAVIAELKNHLDDENIDERAKRSDLDTLLINTIDWNVDDKKDVDFSLLSEKKLVERLKEAGQVEGEDFSADAEKSALIELLKEVV